MHELFVLLAPYGPVGLLCAYFVWRETVRDKRDSDRDARIESILKDNTTANKELTVALTVLSERQRHV